jgi:hypothetical protein
MAVFNTERVTADVESKRKTGVALTRETARSESSDEEGNRVGYHNPWCGKRGSESCLTKSHKCLCRGKHEKLGYFIDWLIDVSIKHSWEADTKYLIK